MDEQPSVAESDEAAPGGKGPYEPWLDASVQTRSAELARAICKLVEHRLRALLRGRELEETAKTAPAQLADVPAQDVAVLLDELRPRGSAPDESRPDGPPPRDVIELLEEPTEVRQIVIRAESQGGRDGWQVLEHGGRSEVLNGAVRLGGN